MRCQALSTSAIATSDQLYIANLRICQISRIKEDADIRKALSQCWRAVELRPESEEAYRARGLALARSKRYEMSLPDLDKAIDLDDADNPKTYSARGFVRGVLEDISGGVADMVTARRIYAAKGEKPPVSLFALQTHMHITERQYRDARAVIAAGREITPDHPDLYRMEALLELAEDDLNGGLLAINKAIKLSPKMAASYAIRGSIYGKEGKLEDMVRDYRVAAKSDKRWSELNDAIAKIDEAFALTKEAHRSLGHDPGSKGPKLTVDACNAMLAFQKAEGLDQDGKFNDPALTLVMQRADAGLQTEQQDPLDLIKKLMRDPEKSGGGV